VVDKVNEAFDRAIRSLENVDENKIRKELEELILNYKVPVDQAVTTVVRKYGGEFNQSLERRKIISIGDEERGVNVVGRILSKNERDIVVEGEERKVFSGTIADDSGAINFTSWKEFPFQKGDVVKINNAYTREWRDQLELQIGDYTDLQKGQDDSVAELKELTSPKKVSVNDVGDVYAAEVEATIVDIQEGSGLIKRCPKCNRAMRGEECQEHGDVKGNPDLRIKAILDDGLGCVQAIFPLELTEDLTDISLEDAIKKAEDALDRTVVEKEMKEIIGKTILVKGRLIGNNFLVDNFSNPKWDPKEKAKKLIEMV